MSKTAKRKAKRKRVQEEGRAGGGGGGGGGGKKWMMEVSKMQEGFRQRDAKVCLQALDTLDTICREGGEGEGRIIPTTFLNKVLSTCMHCKMYKEAEKVLRRSMTEKNEEEEMEEGKEPEALQQKGVNGEERRNSSSSTSTSGTGAGRKRLQYNVYANEVSFAILLRCCCLAASEGNEEEKQSLAKTVRSLWRRMKECRVNPDTVCYNAAINACKALVAFEDDGRRGEEAEGRSGGNGGEGEHSCPYMSRFARSLFQEAKEEAKADIITYNSFLGVLEKARAWEEGILLLGEMEKKGGGLLPNNVSYVHAITACAAAEKWEEALALLGRMRDGLTRADEEGHAMSGGGGGGGEGEEEKADRKKNKKGVEQKRRAVNIHAYNAALAACERCGRWKEALKLMTELEREGLKPDTVTLRSLIFALCGGTRIATAWHFYQACERGDYEEVEVEKISYRILIRGLDFSGYSSALKAFQHLCAAQYRSTCLAKQEGGGNVKEKGKGDVPGDDDEEICRAQSNEDVKRLAPFVVPLPAVKDNSDRKPLVEESSAAAYRRSFRSIHHVPGLMRLPKNMQDLDVYTTTEPDTISFEKGRRDIKKFSVPGVHGAFVLSDVLTPFECQQMVAAAESMGFRPDEPLRMQKIDASEESIVRSGIDTFEWFIDEKMYSHIWERVKDFLPQTIAAVELVGVNRRLRFFRYGENGEYRIHIDGSWPGSQLVNGKWKAYGDCVSKLTFLLYLNDDFHGGSTTFYVSDAGSVSASAVKPRLGSVLCFPHGDDLSSPVHEGEIVSRGTKYVARTDVLYTRGRGNKKNE